MTVTFDSGGLVGDQFTWDFGDGTEPVTASAQGESLEHEFTRAGSYAVTLTAASGGEPPSAPILLYEVAVRPGRLFRVDIAPMRLTLPVTGEGMFRATAFDRYGNEVEGVEYEFAADARAGEIDETGHFVANSKSGDHMGAIVVRASHESGQAEAVADVSLEPGPPASVTVSPQSVELRPNQYQAFEATVADAFGNTIRGASLRWSIPEQLGTINQISGVLRTAGLIPSPNSAQVTATVQAGRGSAAGSATVTILHPLLSEVSHVTIDPPELAGTDGAVDHQFTAIAADRYGNPVPDVQFSWSTTGGTISDSGRLQVEGQGCEYTVTATADTGGSSVSGHADIVLPPKYRPFVNWDFTASMYSWSKIYHVGQIATTADGLLIESLGHDPHVVSAPITTRAGEMLRVTFRMKSNADSSGQLFYAPYIYSFNEPQSVRFPVIADGAWHEYSLEIPALDGPMRIRLDPASAAGEITLAWMRIERFANGCLPYGYETPYQVITGNTLFGQVGQRVDLENTGIASSMEGLTFSVLIDWGDGSPMSSGVVIQDTGEILAGHVYDSAGTYVIRVVAVDQAGGSIESTGSAVIS